MSITRRGRGLENVREIQGAFGVVVMNAYELIPERSPCRDALCDWPGGGSGTHIHTPLETQPEAAS